MTAKRNHYLPRFYLEYFMPETENTFCVYDKETGESRQQTPINTGVEGHLYTFLDEGGSVDDSIETAILAPLDGTVKPILDRWRSRGPVEQDDIPIMAMFLGVQHARVPRGIALVMEYQQQYVFHVLKKLGGDPDKLAKSLAEFGDLSESAGRPDENDLRRVLQDPEKHFAVQADRKAALALSFLFVRTIFEELQQLRWDIIHLADNEDLVTCDAPLVTFAPSPDGRAIFGAGFRLPNVQVTFPLDPKTCLYIHKGDSATPSINEINRRTVYFAERYVVANRFSDEIAAIVAEFSYTRSQPKLDRHELFEIFDEWDTEEGHD